MATTIDQNRQTKQQSAFGFVDQYKNDYVDIKFMRQVNDRAKTTIKRTISAPGRKLGQDHVQAIEHLSTTDSCHANVETVTSERLCHNDGCLPPKRMDSSSLFPDNINNNSNNNKNNNSNLVGIAIEDTKVIPISATNKLKLRITHSNPVGKAKKLISHRLGAGFKFYKSKANSNYEDHTEGSGLVNRDAFEVMLPSKQHQRISRTGLKRHTVAGYHPSSSTHLFFNDKNFRVITKQGIAEGIINHSVTMSKADLDYHCPEGRAPNINLSPLTNTTSTCSDGNHPQLPSMLPSRNSDGIMPSKIITEQPMGGIYEKTPCHKVRSMTQDSSENEDNCLVCLYQTKNCLRCFTCMWCFDAAYYHCSKDDIGYMPSWSDIMLCRGSRKRNCSRLSFFGLASLFMPCLCIYPIANIALNLCTSCRRRYSDTVP